MSSISPHNLELSWDGIHHWDTNSKHLKETSTPRDMAHILSKWLVVNVSNIGTIRKNTAENQFYVDMPLVINDIEYTLIISGNLSIIQQDSIVNGRRHPFNTVNSAGEIDFFLVAVWDIKKWMSFTLMQEWKIIPTNDRFFDQLRRFIPGRHPLSTLPIY